MTFRRRTPKPAPVDAPKPNPKPSKYGNKKTEDGFDSKAERDHYHTLLLAQHETVPSRRVVSIERQVKFELIPAQRIGGKSAELACAYVADFRVVYGDGRVEVQDVKGVRTPDYVIKRKLMLWRHGVRVVEIGKKPKVKKKPAAAAVI